MFTCIYVPDFPVEAIVRAEPLLRERAVAVLEGKAPLIRVIALNEKARLLGMEAGMTKLQAAVFAEPTSPPENPEENKEAKNTANVQGRAGHWGARIAGLAVLRQRSLEQESSAHAAMLDVAHAFSPRVENTAPDTLLLDLAGLERLYGAPPKMASDLAQRVTAVGIEANIAVAANPDAAMHAARGFSGVTVIPVGKEAQRLGVLPLPVLLDGFEIAAGGKSTKSSAREREKLREQMLDTLERWGVRDFRMLALLPEHALASRLGETGVKLRSLARGAGSRTLVLCEPPSQFEEAMELESAVETLEPLSFLLNRMLEQLCARLQARALAVQELHLRLQLEHRVADEQTTTVEELAGALPESHIVAGKPIFARSLRLPVSMRDAKVFLKLLQLDLATHPPGAPVTKIWLVAEPAPPRSAQRGLFVPVCPEAEKLEITLARIAAIVGERRAGMARLQDSHRRESFTVERFTVAADHSSADAPPTLSDTCGQPPLAMRLIRPARRLRVSVVEGRPESLAAEVKQTERIGLQGKVLWSAGPWRSSGDWWTENGKSEAMNSEQISPWDREEWDVAVTSEIVHRTLETGESVALYRIYRDVGTGHWFADASYD